MVTSSSYRTQLPTLNQWRIYKGVILEIQTTKTMIGDKNYMQDNGSIPGA